MDDTSGNNHPVAVIGTTTWGITLAVLLARLGRPVRLWARTEEEARKLRRDQQHKGRLPGYLFPREISITSSLDQSLDGVAVVIFAVPSNTLRANARVVSQVISGEPIIISTSKGLEERSSKRMSEVLAEELPEYLSQSICVLSGPNLAKEIVAGMPASAVVASQDPSTAREAQAFLNSDKFRVYTNSDVIGVELGGALKNVIALGSGIIDGLGFGVNTKAAFVSRGLAEITRLGVALGAERETFSGLAGLGDLVATCFSPLSRNRQLGEKLAIGETFDEAMKQLGGQVAEGVATTLAIRSMATTMSIDVPISSVIYRILYDGLNPDIAVGELMTRDLGAE